ncbi:hypothetical protein BDM02DRAFT_2255397 [Thelephora ganbajun]|uniref:Uncharacterized protein n=1 Tax=Thelephora ganbajun TaxID=370292 RepID=A0ACB6YYA4_THEGA|nr:hypothetical protein BDM02DRAFT_2255397 [Thelephora ganbajun]
MDIVRSYPISNSGPDVPAYYRSTTQSSTLESLTFSIVFIAIGELYFTLASFPNLDDLAIVRSPRVPIGIHLPFGKALTGLRTPGKLLPVSVGTQVVIHLLVSACSPKLWISESSKPFGLPSKIPLGQGCPPSHYTETLRNLVQIPQDTT